MINTHDHEINELYAEVERMHPHLAEVAFTDWAEKNPRMVKEYLLEKKCGKHQYDYDGKNIKEVHKYYVAIYKVASFYKTYAQYSFIYLDIK